MLSVKKLFLMMLLCCLSIVSYAAQSSKTFPISGQSVTRYQPFERQLISFMATWNVPGASVAIVKDGHIVYQRGFGWADIEAHTPVQPDSLFRIASVSKTFTAVTIMKLAQEGKLNLNDKVFDIVDDLQPLNGKPINPQIYKISVLDLLHMSSGWFVSGIGHIDPMFGPWPRYMKQQLGNHNLPPSCLDAVRMMMSVPLRGRPSAIYSYSNLDYCLLGLIINKLSGENYSYLAYQNYVNQHLLYPLSITNMCIGNTLLENRKPNEVRYYRPNTLITDQELINSFYLPYSNTQILEKGFANAGWLSTATDLARFMYDLHAGVILDKKMLNIFIAKPPAFAKRVKNYYTMGMQIHNVHGQLYWVQTGSFTGTNALTVIKPNGTTIAIIFNTRPSSYVFFTRFRPELLNLLISKNTL